MKHRCLLFLLGLALNAHACAGSRGVINDPDGFTNVRARQGADSAILAKVMAGERFEFRGNEHEEWWKVTLASGKTGYMHSSRIRFHATADALADTKPTDEINIWCRREGFDYYPVARAAAKGDPSAMKRFFAIVGDGAAGETHCEVMTSVMHVLGDGKLSKFLGDQPQGYRGKFREHLLDGLTLHPFAPVAYMKRNFPKTAKLLWPE